MTDQTPPSPAAPDFRALFDASPTPSLILSTTFRIEGANPAYLAIAGRTLDDLLGVDVFAAFPDNPDDPLADGVAHLRASLERVLSTGRADALGVQRHDLQVNDPQAPNTGRFEMRHWKPVNTPVFDAHGRICNILHTVEEVPQHYHARTRRLRDVLAHITDAIRDVKTADDIGYRAAAILGRALDVSRVGYGTIDPARETLTVGRDWCSAGIDSVAGVHALRHYGSFIDDLKLDRTIAIADVALDQRTSGFLAALRARSTLALVNVPLVEQGELTAMLFVNSAMPRAWSAEELGLIREVAARIRSAAERLRGVAALRESEARFRTIADAMPQMVWSTLPDGYHDYYNEQWYAFTGVARGSTDGEGWNNLFHPDDQERSRRAWEASLASGTTYEIQYRLRHHSGIYRWVLGRALPVLNEAGHIIRWMGTCTDIHDQKVAEEELRQAARRKDEFLAMLAHELRNPLAPISSAAQLLILGQDKIDAARAKTSGEIILRQVRHLTDLVDDLLDVSRVTRGLVQIEKSDLDLKDVIHSAIEQARPLIEARQHQLTVELTRAPTAVLGDKTRLVQVLVNLLNNAAKYTAPGGQITLTLEADEREACITVTDNGSGIAPALLPSVFDLFVQAERTPDRAQGGLGLGLALVKRIAALHEGSVHALSEGLGQGSSFMILLPLRAAATAAPAPFLSTPAQGTAGAARIMLVDDHADGLQSLAALLTAQGHTVTVAPDAASALRLAAERRTDVFILDIGLPDLDGYELARRLRAAENPARRPLMIALTGYGQAHDRVLSRAAGFDHHLVKPVDFARLVDLLKNR